MSPAVARDPSLSGPNAVQIARAARLLVQREHDQIDLTAMEPFHQFMETLDDPFARAYVAHRSRTISQGRIERDAASDAVLRQLAPAAVVAYEAGQCTAMEALRQAVDDVDPVPLLCGLILWTRFESWGTYYEPHSIPTGLDLELAASIVAGSDVTRHGRRRATSDDLHAVASAARS